VSVVLDTIGGQIATDYVANLGDDSRFVSIVDPSVIAPLGSRGTFFVVEPDRETLERITKHVDAGSVKPGPGESRELKDGASAISAKELGQIRGKLTLAA
jgi:NADPH:quinone reductase-like Zn-dependent oxidoreductase